MKLIKDKKLFGVLNIVDIIVIVLVIAMVGVIAVKLLGSKATDVVAAKTDCWVEVEVVGVQPRIQTEVERIGDKLKGSRMVAGNEYLSGTIEDFWYEEYGTDVTTADGDIVYSTSYTKKNLVFLLKTPVAPDTASPKLGAQELRAGRTLIVKTQTLEVNGIIRYVNIGSYEGGTKSE
jgi:hypothetical protein